MGQTKNELFIYQQCICLDLISLFAFYQRKCNLFCPVDERIVVFLIAYVTIGICSKCKRCMLNVSYAYFMQFTGIILECNIFYGRIGRYLFILLHLGLALKHHCMACMPSAHSVFTKHIYTSSKRLFGFMQLIILRFPEGA